MHCVQSLVLAVYNCFFSPAVFVVADLYERGFDRRCNLQARFLLSRGYCSRAVFVVAISADADICRRGSCRRCKLQARLTLWRWFCPRGIHSRGSVARGFAGAVSECYAWKQRG